MPGARRSAFLGPAGLAPLQLLDLPSQPRSGNARPGCPFCGTFQACRRLRTLHRAFNYTPEEEAPDTAPVTTANRQRPAGHGAQHRPVRLCQLSGIIDLPMPLVSTDKSARGGGGKEPLCACRGGGGGFQRHEPLLKTAPSSHVLREQQLKSSAPKMSASQHPPPGERFPSPGDAAPVCKLGAGGGITPAVAGEGVPRHPPQPGRA